MHTRDQPPIPCVSCGYELAGLTPPGVCPECGQDLDLTLRSTTLTGWPAPRLQEIARGIEIVWIACAAATVVATIIALTGAGILGGAQGVRPLAGLVGIVVAVVAAGSVIGWAMVLRTSRSPACSTEPWRALGFGSGIAAAVAAVVLVADVTLGADPAYSRVSAACILMLLMLACLHLASGAMGLSRLARAMGRPRWSRWAVGLAICCAGPSLMVIGGVVTLALSLVNAFDFDGTAPPPTPTQRIATHTSCCGSIAGLLATGVLLFGGVSLTAQIRALVRRSMQATSPEPP